MNTVHNLHSTGNEKTSHRILTERETEYLTLTALGFNNIKIAYTLCVTRSTVKKTLGNIFYKLSANGRCHAITIAFIHKLFTAETLKNIILKYNLQSQCDFLE